jgi:hypothetical protein
VEEAVEAVDVAVSNGEAMELVEMVEETTQNATLTHFMGSTFGMPLATSRAPSGMIFKPMVAHMSPDSEIAIDLLTVEVAEGVAMMTLGAVVVVDGKLLRPQLKGLNKSQHPAVVGVVHRMAHALVEEHIDSLAMSLWFG